MRERRRPWQGHEGGARDRLRLDARRVLHDPVDPWAPAARRATRVRRPLAVRRRQGGAPTR
jgi:hypothetical protein